MNDCFNKGNSFFFNKYCYTDNCPNDKYKLSDQNNEIKNYFISKLSINEDEIKNKLCICDINDGVWSNYNSNGDLYYQECLNECQNGYEPEEITKFCVEKSEPSVLAEESSVEETTKEESITEESTAEESTAEEASSEESISEETTIEETSSEESSNKEVNEKEISIQNEYSDDCFAL